MKYILVILSFIFFVQLHAQTIPANYCGIQYTYDAAGNRVNREYICTSAKMAGIAAPDIQRVEALYPNPTTGKFNITFTETLNNASVFIADAQGRILKQFTTSGNKIQLDVSDYSAGVYFVKVIQDGEVLMNEKVIKQ